MQKGNIFTTLLESNYFNSYKIKDFIGETIMSIQFIHQSKTGHRSKQKDYLDYTVEWRIISN